MIVEGAAVIFKRGDKEDKAGSDVKFYEVIFVTGDYSQRLVLVGLIFLFVVLGLAVGHNLGMEYLEQRPRSFLESVEFVTQTMTTVGYGQDAPWQHPAMQGVVIITQFAGILIVVTAIPLVLSPWLQERLRRQPPVKYDGPTGHVLVGYYNEAVLSLLNTLERRELPYLLVEPDEDLATQLFREGRNVLCGDPEKMDVLREAKAVEASHFVLAGQDEQNVTTALALQELAETAEIEAPERIAIARRFEHVTHLRKTGIDEVVYPGEIVGQLLVDRLFAKTGMNLEFGCELPEDFQIYEFPLTGDHQLIGRRLKESSLREKLDTNLVGVRRQNQFIASPQDSFRFRRNDVLLLADKQGELERLSGFFVGKRIETEEQRKVVIIGYGNEGRSAHQRLKKEPVEVTVVDDSPGPKVDVVGDGSHEEVLGQAGVETADVVIITVSADDTAIMITLLVRELNRDAEILIQAHQNETIESFYRAGATFVEGLPRVTSRILAGYVVGEQMLDFELEVQLKPVTAGRLAGRSASKAEIRSRHNIIVLGVIRDDELIVPFPGERLFESGDVLLISGQRSAMEKFMNKYSLSSAVD